MPATNLWLAKGKELIKRDCWVLDASVPVKALLNEEHSCKATQLWDNDQRGVE